MKRFISFAKQYNQTAYAFKHITPVNLHSKSIESADNQRTLVFLHDYLSEHKDYEALINKDTSITTKSDLIFYDLRGHGKSLNDGSILTLENNTADIAHDLFQQNLSNVTVAGHGSGGKVAMSLANNHPELVANILLINCVPLSTVPDDIGNPVARVYHSLSQIFKSNLSDLTYEECVSKIRKMIVDLNIPTEYEQVIERKMKWDDELEEYYFKVDDMTINSESAGYMQSVPLLHSNTKLDVDVRVILGEESLINTLVDTEAQLRAFRRHFHWFDEDNVHLVKGGSNLLQKNHSGEVLSYVQALIN